MQCTLATWPTACATGALPAIRGQFNLVIDVCRRSASLSEAGRKLFAVSRLQKSEANDADRLRKYRTRFGLDWSEATSLAAARTSS